MWHKRKADLCKERTSCVIVQLLIPVTILSWVLKLLYLLLARCSQHVPVLLIGAPTAQSISEQKDNVNIRLNIGEHHKFRRWVMDPTFVTLQKAVYAQHYSTSAVSYSVTVWSNVVFIVKCKVLRNVMYFWQSKVKYKIVVFSTTPWRHVKIKHVLLTLVSLHEVKLAPGPIGILWPGRKFLPCREMNSNPLWNISAKKQEIKISEV